MGPWVARGRVGTTHVIKSSQVERILAEHTARLRVCLQHASGDSEGPEEGSDAWLLLHALIGSTPIHAPNDAGFTSHTFGNDAGFTSHIFGNDAGPSNSPHSTQRKEPTNAPTPTKRMQSRVLA